MTKWKSVHGLTTSDGKKTLGKEDMLWQAAYILNGVSFAYAEGIMRVFVLLVIAVCVLFRNVDYADAVLLWQDTRRRSPLKVFMEDAKVANYIRYQNPYVSYFLTMFRNRYLSHVFATLLCLFPCAFLPKTAFLLFCSPLFYTIIGRLTHDSLSLCFLLWASAVTPSFFTGVLLSAAIITKPVAVLSIPHYVASANILGGVLCLSILGIYYVIYKNTYAFRRIKRTTLRNLQTGGCWEGLLLNNFTSYVYYAWPLACTPLSAAWFCCGLISKNVHFQMKYFIWGLVYVT